jgi:7,8-dihydropterin-6-yl-methyl-4-(beta-D-ribofuranosyl)aminobenzene 5'-phosphate synthase
MQTSDTAAWPYARVLGLIVVLTWCLVAPRPAVAQAPASAKASAVKVTVLSTMLAGDARRGVGEWGFAALVDVDGRRLLVDTGARPETVLRNSEELGIDLSSVTDVVLTHNHADHTGGLPTLRRALATKNPRALTRAHVAPQIFWSRPGDDGREGNGLLQVKAEYEAAGGAFVEHARPVELLPGVIFTGPVPRRHPERNFGGTRSVKSAGGLVEDTVQEDSSIVIDTPSGLVVVTGCGHAGVVNITDYARSLRGPAPIHAIVGGLHLFALGDEQLAWTGRKLREFGTANLLGAHCTGIEAVYRLRDALGLTRATAVVGAVGASFTLGKGIDPLSIAQ